MSTTLAADRFADEYLHPHVNSSHAMLMQIVHEWHHLNKYANIHIICKYCYCNSVLFNLIYGQILFPPVLSYCIFLSFLTLNHSIQYAMSYRIQTYRISWDELPGREGATEPEPLAYINSRLCFAQQGNIMGLSQLRLPDVPGPLWDGFPEQAPAVDVLGWGGRVGRAGMGYPGSTNAPHIRFWQ